MKRAVSLFLVFALLACTMIPMAFAAEKAPYSLKYLSKLDGLSYIEYAKYDDAQYNGMLMIERTVEAYDAALLRDDVMAGLDRTEYETDEDYESAVWREMIKPITETFKLAGFKVNGPNIYGRYVYSYGSETFTILARRELAQDERWDLPEEKWVIFIRHEREDVPDGSFSKIRLSQIDGVSYMKTYYYEDEIISNYLITEHTLEMYDVSSRFAVLEYDWEDLIKPFREAFLEAGYEENGPTESGSYEYGRDGEYFTIPGKEACYAYHNRHDRVYIRHERRARIEVLTAELAAEKLNALGLFNGIGTYADGTVNYDLDRAPTRYEAIAMLVRLLGKEEEAFAGTWDMPFKNVASWAQPYVGYAYANGLTFGISATDFGGERLVGASQYLSFVLRALGYIDGEDFEWDSAWILTDEIGLTDEEYDEYTTDFTRADMALVSYRALDLKLKDQDYKLIDVLTK